MSGLGMLGGSGTREVAGWRDAAAVVGEASTLMKSRLECCACFRWLKSVEE